MKCPGSSRRKAVRACASFRGGVVLHPPARSRSSRLPFDAASAPVHSRRAGADDPSARAYVTPPSPAPARRPARLMCRSFSRFPARRWSLSPFATGLDWSCAWLKTHELPLHLVRRGLAKNLSPFLLGAGTRVLSPHRTLVSGSSAPAPAGLRSERRAAAKLVACGTARNRPPASCSMRNPARSAMVRNPLVHAMEKSAGF